jgi:hypothetical protein
MWKGFEAGKFALILLVFPVAFLAEAASEAGGFVNVVWEPEFLEVYGQAFIVVPIVMAAITAVVVWYRARRPAV